MVVQGCPGVDWGAQVLVVQLIPMLPEVVGRVARLQVTLSVQLPLWDQVPFAIQVAVGVPMKPGAQTAEQTLWNTVGRLPVQFQLDVLTVLLGRAGGGGHRMGSHEPL